MEDLAGILCIHPNEVNKYLAVIEADGLVESISMDRGVFLSDRATQQATGQLAQAGMSLLPKVPCCVSIAMGINDLDL